MQKVVYSIKKVNRDERIKGIGYLADGNLLIPAKAKNGNPYIRVFDDVSKHCTAIPDRKMSTKVSLQLPTLTFTFTTSKKTITKCSIT